MKHRIVSTKDAPQRLEENYPQLNAVLSDMEGFKKFVMARLKFQLDGRYSPDDIINECILRWHKAVEAGKPIPVLDGWMRLTAQNVVRELSRKNQKVYSYEPTVLAELISGPHDEPKTEDEQHRAVHQTLQALPQEKRELLELRFFHNLSWKDIADAYTNQGKKTAVPALRKRGERAMEELRQVFLNILKDT
jgi:RNA polymerase sigma factor (sigma-70 family)